ncbi:hypothetical protein HEQ69_04580 [Haematospirillum jordaniae]|uniref:hypothetical protein n=1 Tax=Haematospirillum jordaniae TaxID=1549855 RepID=UPI001432CAD2|nr:hypothetical protein [Haematospirillum jordaniae]NKD44993.1 hypothetical protein [Haematospirillum jordaniae]NKD92715.1 hypothetical protein [Haematospirillum jordaniae]
MLDNAVPPDEKKTVPIIPAPLDDGPNDAASKESALFSSGSLGCVTLPSTRRQRVYSITATELMILEQLKASENKDNALGTATFSSALTLAVTAIFSDFERLSALAQAVTYVLIPVLLTWSIVTFFSGRNTLATSREMLRILKEETEHIELLGGRRQ